MIKDRVKLAGAFALACLCGIAPSTSAAGEWPEQPIQIIVPYSAGGAVDVLTRIISKEMSKDLGQPIIVQPRPGGEGNIAALAVARAKPDGYTLLSSSAVLTSIPVLFDDIEWSPKDFASIARFATSSGFIISSAKLPFKTIPELKSYVQKHPDLPSAVLIGGAYTTIVTHMVGKATGIDLLFVPYQGAAQHMTDLYEGRVALATVSGNLACGAINDNKVNILAITGDKRSSAAPDIPTTKEAGIAEVNMQGWYGLHAPAGTPPDRVAKIAQALDNAVKKDSVRQALEKACVTVAYQNPEEFGKFVNDDIKHWKEAAPMIKTQGKMPTPPKN